ncbi:hypothetical protein Y032_0058g2893 [Ancylostoma ceylanicum]|uniref:Uncharacterized protein n=2 Tax=Ancylostoma ceylanicum TaxID=53326 RepID=A0A016U3Q0_9BILA|nr:hypothetical protein Y032_0058g2893 [Ancylostoma ceylanicum]
MMVYPVDESATSHGLAYYADIKSSRSPAAGIPDDKINDGIKTEYTDASSPHFIQDTRTRMPWIANEEASAFFVNLLTCLYALIITIVALIIEVSPTWRDDILLANTIFFLFMYGIGIVFFIYCYLFAIHPQAYNFIIERLGQLKCLRCSRKWMIEKTNHPGEGAGTLYLRIGALLFGSAGIVLFGLELFTCIEKKTCTESVIAKLQLDLIRGKLGMMHLVSVNLWTWFRFVLAKNVHKLSKKAHQTTTETSPSSNEEEGAIGRDLYLVTDVMNRTLEVLIETTTAAATAPAAVLKQSLGAMDQFGDLATFLTTCIVEYSLIGAAMMFIQWKSIGIDSEHHHEEEKQKRKQKMRIDYSGSIIIWRKIASSWQPDWYNQGSVL